MKTALRERQNENFSAWYQEVIKEANLAEESGVRGCMIIKPWGNGIWERIKTLLNADIEETGHENCYFPLLIPMKNFAKEAEHVEGFATEMAVVTHHRLKKIDGVLQPDPDAKLEEPLIIRPTSETIFGDAMSRWIQSYRDLPLLLNQWANVMRWEMRPRLFLRTSEFLWQEGHTAHATREEAMEETLRIFELYRALAENVMSLPVVGGSKPEHERFPGALETFTIEGMMRDGHAIQAGTSHYLGTNFAKAQEIRYQNEKGEWVYAHTTSWGVSTRLIGALIMTHGDDDGLRLPPRVAPAQIIISPMIKNTESDADVRAYCEALLKALKTCCVFGEPLRVRIDAKGERSQNKLWSWIKKGVPIICEIGPRDVKERKVTFLKRDALRHVSGKINFLTLDQSEFLAQVKTLLEDVQTTLFEQAKAFRDAHTYTDVRDFNALETLFASGPAWARLPWSRPSGEKLDALILRLKKLKLTVRVIPFDQKAPIPSPCFFTGEPAVEEIIVAKAY